ncbi:MAG: hypothetical protein R8K22_04710 [Mariprofundaceae bacterium]
MRVILILLLAIALMAVMTLFPEIARQSLKIEAFGWLFETKQGAFVVVLFLLLTVLWLLRRIISAIIAGPGQLWQTLRVGGKKRREHRLREGLAQWLDMRDDLGAKALKKSRHVIPDWGLTLLKILPISAKDQVVGSSEDDKLAIVLAARIATNPDSFSKPDVATRKVHLEAWLQAHPGAPLALSRLADLAQEGQDWKALIQLLEETWKRGQRSASSVKIRLAKAYVSLAAEQSENRQANLRKAHRLAPENPDVLLALGHAYCGAGDTQAAQKLWLRYLQKKEDWDIADALFNIMKADALKTFQQLDKRADQHNLALSWVHACLAHAAKLDGLAHDMIAALLEKTDHPQVLQTRAQWHVEAGEWEQAALYYQKLLR